MPIPNTSSSRNPEGSAVDYDDPVFLKRRERLRQLPPTERITEIDADLKRLVDHSSTAGIFHRKKLLRMRDRARLEAGMVTPAQLQRENSAFNHLDFSKAQIVWRSRRVSP